MNLLTKLNSKQRQAVTSTEGPVLVLAGAGSGKTRVLTYRVAYLLQEKGIAPENILAITFTNKAADEMKERLADLVGLRSDSLWVSTFHSACVRILRREISRLGYNRNFVIYDTADQHTLLKNCLRELNLDDKKFPVKSLASVISQAKNNLWSPQRYEQMAGSFYERVAADVYRLYQEKLRENNALDFDDLIMQTVFLLAQYPEVLQYYQKLFRYIMIDEYQDTNHAQYILAKLLAGGYRNICAVGDPDQSIYGWRGADIQNILNFEKDYSDALIIKLEQNYRSTKTILQAANEVIRYNQSRKEKNLWTENEEGLPLVVYPADDEWGEAWYVAQEIYRLKQQEGIPYGHCAVLYRVHAQSRALEEALVKAGIPYQIMGGLKFYERKEIKDILAYLRVIQNPDDSVSLYRIINVPRRGIGEVTWVRLAAFAGEKGISIYEALRRAEEIEGLSSRVLKPIVQFVEMMDSFIELKDKIGVTELTRQILDKTGIVAELEREKTTEAETRLENLREFLSVTEKYERSSEEATLEGFLAEVSLVSEIDNYEEEEEVVVLMTLHTAKGLEFPVVFLVGMEEGVFPHSRALLEPGELEEERRLCYVGMTRAQKRLYLTHARRRTLYGNLVSNPPSRFLEEIPEELITSPGGQEKEEETDKKTAFSPGDKVYHSHWGEGVVVAVKGDGSDTRLKVAFPDRGIKELLVEYAPLRKIH
ncbi:DNA helicase PcrA [Calderihabitans maritimus]|uniref:ATP-dependent DNA helicase n=1 Tax=Calderihabitans maritimus TaxID=1246530 RepID=A0A1Z5HQB0_9FIRM|nr:DNA helicase PcrA [Calderihabitans maritimus]GAW91557.1 ATP-dependent DNA helicase PcrA [Calderihabitans maritimus]